MTKTTMQQVINESFGTFEDEAHKMYRYNDTAGHFGVIRETRSVGCSYETVGGVMYDWIPCVVEDEE